MTDKYGLSSEQITRAVEVALHCSMDLIRPAVRPRLIKCLIPRRYISDHVVVTLLGRWHTIPLPSRLTWLKWLLCVYDFVEHKAQLHKLYSVFFHMLEYETLRPLVCQMLYRLTRRQDVKPFRIRKLYELRGRFGDELALAGLMDLYKIYHGDMQLVSSKANKSAHFFKPPDRKLSSKIVAVQNRWSSGTSSVTDAPLSLQLQRPSVSSGTQNRSSKEKRQIANLIPAVSVSSKSKQVSVEEIGSLEELVTFAAAMELPSNLGSVLTNPTLQHFISLSRNPVALNRIRYWIAHLLEDELIFRKTNVVSTRNEYRFQYLFSSLLNFCSFIQEVIPEVESFLIQYIRTWDGVEEFGSVLELVSRMRPRPYEQLYESILKPIHRLYIVSSAWVKAQIITSHTNLLRRWCRLDWQTYFSSDLEKSKWAHFIFGQIPDEVDHLRTIFELIQYLDQLCVIGLAAESDHVLIQDAALSLFELVSELGPVYSVPFVIAPSPSLVYRMFLSSSAMAVTRICGVLVGYKTAFEHLKQTDQTSIQLSFRSGIDKISSFNSFIWDFCNTLWRNVCIPKESAVPGKTQPKTFLFDFDSDSLSVIQSKFASDQLNPSLSVTHGFVFIAMSASFLNDRGTFGDQKALKGDGRIDYLSFLKERKCNGLYDFLHTFISSLMQRRTKRMRQDVEEPSSKRVSREVDVNG
eukprot:GILJ01013943.1.p1 GENE.GILJ01013943.1~~GILJ01013943.1.p1  ORF type:complete len:748 (+),score=102.95 GILJ01013943.1:172-2244(+)